MLERIVADKREAVRARVASRPLASFRGSLAPSDRSLAEALSRPRTGFILECKKASPSQGSIRPDFDPVAIAHSYAAACDAISVLTDEPYFGGRLEYLRQVREAVDVPVLCKDFVVDPYQIHEARHHGADAVLLMCSVLDQGEIRRCLEVCHELGMDALVEVHDRGELDRAVDAGADIIGINNRDLSTLRVDLATTRELSPLVPRGKLCVCESGIADHRDVVALRGLCDAFLVGESLMRQPDLDDAVRALVYGRVKICGLTRREDAALARAAGATFGGLVLWPGSPRAVTLAEATKLADVDLGWVGVFVDEEPARIVSAAETLDLHAVQLHGHEDAATVIRLREALAGRQIWKARRVRPTEGEAALDLGRAIAEPGCDRLLLDAYRPGVPGGTGTRFDWQRLRHDPLRCEVILSGGLSPDNVVEADELGCWALDVSSGVEAEPGRKSPERLVELFRALRGGHAADHMARR